MSDAVLLSARCYNGHTWDLWGERNGDDVPTVERRALHCPECDEDAEHVGEPEQLA